MRLLNWSAGVFLAIGNLGPDLEDDSEARRIRALNLVAFTALTVNVGFTIAFALTNYSALAPVIIPNVLWSLGYLTTLFLNSRGRFVAAMWTLVLATVGNLSIAGLFFGLSSGLWLFLILLPILATLLIRPGNRAELILVVGGGSVAFAVVASLAGDVPGVLAGTAVPSMLLFSAAVTTALFAAVIALYYRKLVEQAEARSQWLLLNILPVDIAKRLKAGESPIADRVEEVTILFSDLIGSTAMADQLSADDLVDLLNRLFSAFDDIADECGLEKIKTVGDGYLAVAGLPAPRSDHAQAAAQAAIRMRDELENHVVDGFGTLQMRFGLHTGSVVAGVIGKRKFTYDLWGDAVNMASRMESSGLANQIQVSSQTHDRLEGQYRLEPRGKIEVKGKGELETHILLGPRLAPTSHPE